MSSRLRLVRLVDLGWIWLIWWIGLIRVNLVITGGLQRNLNCALLMFNALMRWSSVDGGTPSFAAAPDEPPTRPRHTAGTASMGSRSLGGAPRAWVNAATGGRSRTGCVGSHDS